MNNSAISYLRFSSSKQRKGASYDRQIEATEKFCAQNNLVLIDKIEDKGISGWNEDNLEETAALGKLLKLIESGAIKKGTTLIVENLDRITRANLTKAIHLVTGILQSGIDIVTTMDGKRYQKDASTTDLMIAIIYLTRGNDESETKSKRVKQAWQKKRQLINEGKFVKLTQHPNWLIVENNQYVENKTAADLVRKIFDMYVSGIGSHLISKHLNKECKPPFSRTGTRFTFSSIERLLKNPAVIGRCEVVSPPKENYYPKIISESIWYQAQAIREKNNHYKGTRNDSDKVNFLTGILQCRTCGNSMVRYSCGRKNQRYHYLVCSGAKYGEHKMVLFNYENVQKTFLSGIYKANFLNSFLGSKKYNLESGKLEALNGKLLEIKSKITNVCDAIEETGNSELKQRLISLQNQKIETEKDLEKHKKSISDLEYNLSTKEMFLKLVLKDLDNNKFRIRIRNFLRSIVKRSAIWKDKENAETISEKCDTIIHVEFNESSDVLFLVTFEKELCKTAVVLNGKVIGFTNTNSTLWFDGNFEPQEIDPFFIKMKKSISEKINLSDFGLRPSENTISSPPFSKN